VVAVALDMVGIIIQLLLMVLQVVQVGVLVKIIYPIK